MAIQAQMYQDNFGLPLGLGGSQDFCGLNNDFNFNLQQKLQQQQQFQYQQQLQFTIQPQNLLSSNDGYMFNPFASMNSSQSLASQIEKQRLDLDRFISLQNERLKLVLQEQRKQILNKVEEKAAMFLRRKEEEIEKARKTAMDLEELARNMEAESESWQRIAAEHEAMVFTLSRKLDELKEQACCSLTSDAESCCDLRNRGSEEEETGEESRKMRMLCRVCKSRNACVLFLPCRHLCSCKDCEAFLESCPVCKSAKKASIEALIS